MTPATPTPRLLVGDPAPALKVKRFVKGEPVLRFQPGQVYVVEFWATWCRPCLKSIPHISDLQAKYPQVTFVGVGVLDTEQNLEHFVVEQGDAMGYRVAIDAPLEGAPGDRDEGWMVTNWIKACGRMGIPDAFVIDSTGHIAWAGLPLKLEPVLEAVLSGDWAFEEARQAQKHELASTARVAEMHSKIDALFESQAWAELASLCDSACAEQPELAHDLIGYRMVAHSHLDSMKAYRCAHDLFTAMTLDVETFYDVRNLIWLCINSARVEEEKAGGGDPDASRELRLLALKHMQRVLTFYETAKPTSDDLGGAPVIDCVAGVPNQLAILHMGLGNYSEALSLSQRAFEATLREQPDEMSQNIAQHIQDECQARIALCKAKLVSAPTGRRVVCDGDVCRIVTS